MIDLSDLVQRAAAFGLANATTHVVETAGEPLTDLATLLRGLPDPLLCIATHGHSALGELAFSSATEQLLLTNAAPALVVGPHAEAGHVPAVLAVGVRPDGLPLPLARAVQSWQATFGGAVELVEVVHPELTPRPIPRELFVAASALGHPVRSIESNDPVQALLDLASERDVLLAVASDLPRGVRRMLHGSVAWEVIRYSPGPVLVVHAPHR
jgi:nucleotide-binding universal stress UspA family protein